MSLVAIPCMLMRGGTSKGPYFDARDLPTDPAARDRVLLSAMGSPDVRQVDGLGGADSLTSKAAIVSKSDRPGVDVEYLFAQVAIDQEVVDVGPSCGNMLSGVAPFAIENGLVSAAADETRVMIFNINTSSLIEAIVQTPNGKVNYEGSTHIDGVPGGAAPLFLNFMDIVGSKTGTLLPTGQVTDRINGITVTCIDVAMPMVLMNAHDLGLTGYESRDEIDTNRALFDVVEPIRIEAGLRMGLGDVSRKVIPKIGILSPPQRDGTVCSRYFTPWKLHAAHAVTGAICVASACALEGSVASHLLDGPLDSPSDIGIEHPSGRIDVRLEMSGSGASLNIQRAGILRTTRLIMRGEVLVPMAE